MKRELQTSGLESLRRSGAPRLVPSLLLRLPFAGPYSFLDVAVPTDARNSAPITLPDGSYAIFHIQEGNTDPEEVVHWAPEFGGRNAFPPPENNFHALVLFF